MKTAKLMAVSMKDLKERMPWVRAQYKKYGFVVITHRREPVAVMHRLWPGDLELTKKALKRIGKVNNEKKTKDEQKN